ncbi:MAG: YceI family protein [Chitinophagaceae bacterium]|jgi:polyisoprenoid-binding protein YceI|nr:YceI family protein [Chitinophagaceae bacterium]MCE2972130.1 YceI family protein [Sediminibacterium sp.]MCA6468741.1 YceI family protein [Chitinophagaceae bacterium]MCA6469231.1 YceI family protein [Chitinophagaceae bacterium]MCA6474130.1 YceI family protein [Chitinophagaceae bacterium]
MKYLFTICLTTFALLSFQTLNAQKTFGTRNGQIIFQSPTDQDVKAINNEVNSRLSDNGSLSFSLLIKSFRFKMAEMQDHFNTEYLHSNQFPRGDFKGTITNIKTVNFNQDGIYPVEVTGDLTLHGVTKKVSSKGSITIKNGKPLAKASFPIIVKDFGIKAEDVTEKVTITVNCQYQ